MQNPNVLLTSQSIPCTQVPGKLGKPLKDEEWAWAQPCGDKDTSTPAESQEGSWKPAKSGAAQKTRAGIPPEGWNLRSQTDSPDKSRSSKSSGNNNKTITVEQLRERSGRKHTDLKME